MQSPFPTIPATVHPSGVFMAIGSFVLPILISGPYMEGAWATHIRISMSASKSSYSRSFRWEYALRSLFAGGMSFSVNGRSPTRASWISHMYSPSKLSTVNDAFSLGPWFFPFSVPTVDTSHPVFRFISLTIFGDTTSLSEPPSCMA